MLTINKYDNTVAFVVVPEMFDHASIYNGKCIIENGGEPTIIPLPPGKWELLFRHSEAKESDFEKVVDRKYVKLFYFKGWKYKKYTLPSLRYTMHRAEYSFRELLSAHSIQLTEHQDLLILKKVEK